MGTWFFAAVWLQRGYSFLGVVIGCQGGLNLPEGSSGGQTADVLPSGIALDISEFPDDSTNADKEIVSDRTFAGDQERVCYVAGAILYGFHRLLDRGLALAAALNHDLEDPSDPHLQGSFFVGGQMVDYKADFSAFDIDGNGTADGSGRFDTEPVALRLWVIKNGVEIRLLCGLITTRATRESVGAGEVYLQPGVVLPLVNPDFKVFARWDRTDDAHQWNEAFTVGRLRVNVDSTAGHHRVDVDTFADGSIQKTLKSTTSISNSDFLFSELRYAARTLRGSGFALVNTEAAGTPNVSVTGLCESIGQCVPAAGSNCAAIDSSGMDFLPASASGETEWPADYPESATFYLFPSISGSQRLPTGLSVESLLVLALVR
jgi:hypothetical protein